MAGQSRKGRSLESWNALTQGNRRRWIRAFGGEDAALEAYRNGLSLTSSQRGHGATPERPIRALLQPWKFPAYTAKHTEQLNELARKRGLAEHGKGPRGETPQTKNERKLAKEFGDFTWVVPNGTVSLPDWRFSQVFRTEPEAQLFARRSWAPAGVVIIMDNKWEAGLPQPPATKDVYRYEVWFGQSESRKKKKRKKR